MKKSRIIAAALAAVLLVGGAVMKICGADSNKELEPTLPLETKISKEQAIEKFLSFTRKNRKRKSPCTSDRRKCRK